ncbi:nucleoside 2-deoxyribosyltransferase [Bacillus sp. Bos-x628]|uniref:nucleoside 2-deoxyribosyltransferase n=1 Tax=Bacillus maqinnsis TaxID=3229854 RepID=UPI00338EE760
MYNEHSVCEREIEDLKEEVEYYKMLHHNEYEARQRLMEEVNRYKKALEEIKNGRGMKMKRVYLASPFFNELELSAVKEIAEILKSKGLEVFEPMLNQMEGLEAGTRHWSIETFRNDVKFIDWAEAVVMVYFGNYSDSGTAWEAGYAYGTQKPVIVVHVGEDSNLMVHESAHANLSIAELRTYDFEILPSSNYTGKMF